MSNKLDGITLHAEGEANCYRLMRGGNWLAAIRMNGELLVWDQEAILRAMLHGEQQAAQPIRVGDLTPQQRLELARGTEAAPVGEREAFDQWFFCASNSLLAEWEDAAWEGFQAGAAHQRQSGVANDAEGSAVQKSFWAGFELAALRLFDTDIRKAWNHYRATAAFARLNKGAGNHE